jgi:hypothetical protein
MCPLFFILGGLKEIPAHFLERYPVAQAGFVVNESGWMTRATFLLWARMFVAWIADNRRMGNFAPTVPIVLFLDGHISRDCAAAIQLLSENNVIAITFPGQLTHVLQPVDVCIGGPFRQYYRRALRKLKLRWKQTRPPEAKLAAVDKREMIVAAAVDAAQQSTTKSNREAAFTSTGLCPYNPNTPCQSPYVKQDLAAPVHPEGRIVKRDTVSAKVLTSPDVLSTLSQ